jgi:hypothetical protein
MLLLEELVSSELEGTLEEVTGGRGAEAGKERASTLRLDDLAETANHTPVVGGGVELDSRLHAVEKVSVNDVHERRLDSTFREFRGRPEGTGAVAIASERGRERTHRRE